ncbi:MAG: hypothetical protein ACFFD2_08250, partial [Promethearchaeota archaeon]
NQKEAINKIKLEKKQKEKQKKEKESVLKEGKNKKLEKEVQNLLEIIQEIDDSIKKQEINLKIQEEEAQKRRSEIQQQKEEIREQSKSRKKTKFQKQKEIQKIDSNIQKLKDKIIKYNEKMQKKNEILKNCEEDFNKQEEDYKIHENELIEQEKKIKDQKKIIRQRILKKEEKLKREKAIKDLINLYRKIVLQFIQGKMKNPEEQLSEAINKLHNFKQIDHIELIEEWLQAITSVKKENKERYFLLLKRIKEEPQLVELLKTIPNKEEYIEKIEELIGIKKKKQLQKSIKGEKKVESSVKKVEASNYFLIFSKENLIKFTIELENTTSSAIKAIHVKKYFTQDFYELEVKNNSKSNIKIDLNQILWQIDELKPHEKVISTILTKILPTRKEIIGTGNIEVSFIQENSVISGTKIEDFSAFSHAMHIIKKKEKDIEPNKWKCSLVFKNDSEFNMGLKSILILDKLKETKFIEQNFKSTMQKIISPGETFVTDPWEVENKIEPQFSRKIDYSVSYVIERNSNINIEPNFFDILDIQMKKTLSKVEIRSFEESELNNTIFIKNVGTVPINGILIKDVIPEDFLPLIAHSAFKIHTSSGTSLSEYLEAIIFPPDENPSKKHILKILINLIKFNSGFFLMPNEFLEINYILKAVNPDYRKIYQFPLEIVLYYTKTKESEQFQKVFIKLPQNQQPVIKIVHKRRNIEIGKEIYPGRSTDEFAISIVINNRGDTDVSDITITDTVPKAFEIVSSNLDHNITDSDQDGCFTISFNIENIRSYQEKEIRYYIRNKSGEKITFSELESFIIS